uniref:TraX family protein n=1 Tax=Escherichia coli TaxID=562 RepID=UPI003CF96CEF
SSGEYLPGSLQGKISSDGCLKKEQMVVSAIASTPQSLPRFWPGDFFPTFYACHLAVLGVLAL